MPPYHDATALPGRARPALRPRALRAGSRVALVAPAGPVDPDRVERSEARCRAMGFEPILAPGARGRHRFFSGTDADRLADLQAAFDDPGIDAVWALRGGYGTLRLLGRLSLARQWRDPIPFIGFSDNTSIHARHAALGVVSFHGPHPGGDWPPETEAAFLRVLCSSHPPGPVSERVGDPRPRTLRSGCVEAPLVGGNLAILAAMCGTRHRPDARGRILCLEDVGEPAYRVDRMLWQLRASGAMDGAVGLAFGRFTGADEDPHPISEVLADHAVALGVPAVEDLPFGHVEHNATLPVGSRARLDADAGTLDLTEAAVRSV